MKDKWIWQNNYDRDDEYVDFVDFFDGEVGHEFLLDISVSCDYIAYLNGIKVGYGQYRDYVHYKIKDTLDLTPYIKTGKNRLCIIGYHSGGKTFTNAIRQAGLYFAVWHKSKIVVESSTNTLCRLAKDYRSHRCVMITPQLGFDYSYDADCYDGWLVDGEDGFDNAVVANLQVEQLLPRPNYKLSQLPFLQGKIIQQGTFCWTLGQTTAQKTMSAALAYRNKNTFLQYDGESYSVATEEICDGIYLTFDLGKEEVGNLSFDIQTPEKTKLYIGYGEHLDAGRVSTQIGIRSFCVEYYTNSKGARQIFEGVFRRLGGRYLTLFICGKSINIYKFGIIPLRYPLNKVDFSCGNLLRDKIYSTSVRTLELCMHEAYEDCPWREQSFYNMDSRNQMLCGYYAFNEYAMPRASLELVSQGMRDDGLLSIVFPAGSDLPIPSFNLIVFTQFKEYMLYSKDFDFVRKKLAFLDRLMQTFINKAKNTILLPNFSQPCWNFYEWQPTLEGSLGGADVDRGFECPLSAFFAFALGEYAEILRLLGNSQKADEYELIKNRVNGAIKSTFYVDKDKLFKSFSAANEPYSVLVNALCVLCGAAEGVDLTRISQVLKGENSHDIIKATLSMAIFRYDALLMIDKNNLEYILNDIDNNYFSMLLGGATTFWETSKGSEDFDGAGSLCHGWSALPIIYYQKYLKNVAI